MKTISIATGFRYRNLLRSKMTELQDLFQKSQKNWFTGEKPDFHVSGGVPPTDILVKIREVFFFQEQLNELIRKANAVEAEAIVFKINSIKGILSFEQERLRQIQNINTTQNVWVEDNNKGEGHYEVKTVEIYDYVANVQNTIKQLKKELFNLETQLANINASTTLEDSPFIEVIEKLIED